MCTVQCKLWLGCVYIGCVLWASSGETYYNTVVLLWQYPYVHYAVVQAKRVVLIKKKPTSMQPWPQALLKGG